MNASDIDPSYHHETYSVRVSGGESLDGEVVVDMMHLNISGTVRNVRSLVCRLAGVNAVPADRPYEDFAVAFDLLRREARCPATRARQAKSFLDRCPELILTSGAVANGDHLHDGRIDGLPWCVRPELDGIAPGLSVEDIFHLTHGLGVGIA